MRITRPLVRSASIVALALASGLALGCNGEATAEDPMLLCGFDGDASPGYQGVVLHLSAEDGTGQSVTTAPAGSIITVVAGVYATLAGVNLCNTDIAWEVTEGGGATSEATSNTGSTKIHNNDFLATVDWTLGAPGSQTLHGYLPDDNSIEATITVTATPAAATGLVTLYNATDASAYMIGPGETAGPGNLLASHFSRTVSIPTAVGSQSEFRAYKTLGAVAAMQTCSVLASAWQGGTQPLVVFYDNEGNYLTCEDGLGSP